MRLELRASRQPHPRSEDAEIVAVGHGRQADEDILHVGHGVLAVVLARDNQGVEDGRALSGVGMTDKQPVFLADAPADRRALGIEAIALLPPPSSPHPSYD
jgi:hypothetical protein